MNFKLEYLNQKEIVRFIQKRKHIDMIMVENITYASIGLTNPARSSNNIYKLNKIPSLPDNSGFNNNIITREIYLSGDTILSNVGYQLAYYEDGIIELLSSYINELVAKYKYIIEFNNEKTKAIITDNYHISNPKIINFKLNNNYETTSTVIAKENNKTISFIKYSLDHIDTTETELGHYIINIVNLEYIKLEKESVFYLIKEIVQKHSDIYIKKIRFSSKSQKNRFMKYVIFYKFNDFNIIFD